MPSFLAVDYTHRLVFEKYNICVMGTLSATQNLHVIALAMTSEEDTATHEHIFTLVRDEVNSLVDARARATPPQKI
jgi:hypothetical protein